MLLPVLVLTVLVTVPNALAGPALHEGITLFAARRTQLLGWGLVFRGGSILPFRRFAKRHRTELLSSRGRHRFFLIR